MTTESYIWKRSTRYWWAQKRIGHLASRGQWTRDGPEMWGLWGLAEGTAYRLPQESKQNLKDLRAKKTLGLRFALWNKSSRGKSCPLLIPLNGIRCFRAKLITVVASLPPAQKITLIGQSGLEREGRGETETRSVTSHRKLIDSNYPQLCSSQEDPWVWLLAIGNIELPGTDRVKSPR